MEPVPLYGAKRPQAARFLACSPIVRSRLHRFEALAPILRFQLHTGERKRIAEDSTGTGQSTKNDQRGAST